MLQLFTVNQVADDSCPNIVTLSEKKYHMQSLL